MLVTMLLILVSVEKSWTVRCVYCQESFDWSWSNVSWKELDERMIDNVEMSDYDESKNELCRLEIYLDYQSNRSSISFGDSFQWTELNREELRLDYLIRLAEDEDEQFYNVLEYACANQDQCERNTLQEHLQWLTNVDYSLFHRHLQTLFFAFNSTVKRCLTDKKSFEPCSTGSCSGRYSTYYDNIQSECSPYPSTSTEIHLTINLIYNQFYQSIQEAKILRYLCQFDQCNDEQFTHTFIELVNRYFPLDPMRKALLRSLQTDTETGEEETPPTSTSTSTSTAVVHLLKGESISFQLDRLSQRNSVERSAQLAIHLLFFPLISSVLF